MVGEPIGGYEGIASAPREGDSFGDFDLTEEEDGSPDSVASSGRWTDAQYAQRTRLGSTEPPYGFTAGSRTRSHDNDPAGGSYRRGNRIYTKQKRVADNVDPEGFTEGFEADLVVNLATIFKRVIAFAGAHTARTFIYLAEDIKRRSHEGVYVDASQRVAFRARAAIVAAYLRARRESTRRGANPYRVGERFAGGLLEDGLRDPRLMPVNGRSGAISISPSVLSGYALQWGRLNYGAGDAGNAPAHYSIQASNLIVEAALGLEPASRPAFSIPSGFWTSSGQFFPTGLQAGIPASADIPQHHVSGLQIKAENWLDAGVRYIANNAGQAWVDAFGEKVYAPAAAEARAHGSVNVTFPQQANWKAARSRRYKRGRGDPPVRLGMKVF